jgi:hypothetical protein
MIVHLTAKNKNWLDNLTLLLLTTGFKIAKPVIKNTAAYLFITAFNNAMDSNEPWHCGLCRMCLTTANIVIRD